MQCIDQAYWGIFPHFEVTRFLSDSVRDSSETCFWFWDYHIPHYLGYSFEIRFRVSPLRHWSILHSDFLADYYWVEDSWLMMLDSSFGCASYIHTGAYFPLPPRFLPVIVYGTRMDDWWRLFSLWLWHQASYWGIFPYFLSILEIETVTSLVLNWVLAQSFRRSTVSGPPYMDLLR